MLSPLPLVATSPLGTGSSVDPMLSTSPLVAAGVLLVPSLDDDDVRTAARPITFDLFGASAMPLGPIVLAFQPSSWFDPVITSFLSSPSEGAAASVDSTLLLLLLRLAGDLLVAPHDLSRRLTLGPARGWHTGKPQNGISSASATRLLQHLFPSRRRLTIAEQLREEGLIFISLVFAADRIGCMFPRQSDLIGQSLTVPLLLLVDINTINEGRSVIDYVPAVPPPHVLHSEKAREARVCSGGWSQGRRTSTLNQNHQHGNAFNIQSSSTT